MSIHIPDGNLKEEGESLFFQLRSNLKEFKDIFRLNCSDLYFETIKKMKEDLNIAESVAICEQLKREDQPLNDTFYWYNNYEQYIKDKKED